tara:strand:- start:1975 stop:2208 length:234 start_codon:yes stop_codon:yes gene_type:complete
MEWLTWANFAYMMAIILAAVGTMVATKYRIVIKELKEVADTYHTAMKDGELDEKEKQKLAKECMDVVMSVVRLVWKF